VEIFLNRQDVNRAKKERMRFASLAARCWIIW